MSERKTTRFAVLEAERVVKVHEREIPALKADEVLIKNGACNICTTDYVFSFYRSGFARRIT